MPLTALLYTSKSTAPVDLDDLLVLQHQAICNNPRANITGILFHLKGHFVQLLEGENDSVLQLFVKIVQDDRHRDVRLLYHRDAEQRLFADWHMAMLDLDLHSEGKKLDVQDLVFYADQLNTDPDAKERVDEILRRFQRFMLIGQEEDERV